MGYGCLMPWFRDQNLDRIYWVHMQAPWKNASFLMRFRVIDGMHTSTRKFPLAYKAQETQLDQILNNFDAREKNMQSQKIF